ncbi:uncharacterized protein LOC115765757 [Drosophila novamexicana]|uniref:uncharacterized protein LOC115765757 n=1 Tax=Drosophila novamexicana TaxID=47314 RepID=UPI0011E58951|nr:uncharacterized protein LOC115765757 [Drosophila novamexicana]
MPLELIVISLMRTSKWINVLMLNSPDEDKARQQTRRIDVSANGIRWIERDFEQFTPLGKFFEINTNPEAGITVDKETNNATALKLSLVHINDAALDQQTVDVSIEDLHLLLNESMACGLHCSNCYNELVPVRRYDCIRPMPVYTMEPIKYFCPSDKKPTSLAEGELFYALNYIVISPKILGKRVIQCGQHIHCGRCLQLVGESLGEKVATQLYVDTLWVAPRGQSEVQLPEGRLEQLFGQLTVSQIMLHLLQDAVPISEEKTRLFLKTVRPDGQLHYMLLLVDTSQLHLLRSKLSLIEDLNVSSSLKDTDDDTNEDSDNSSESSSDCTSDSDLDAVETSDDDESEPKAKRQRRAEAKPVHEVKVRGYRGCRINYHIFSSDEELAANHEMIEKWRREGTPMLRISYVMMMDLLRELNVNELLVATLERIAPDEKEGHTSYIIYEPVEDM